MTDNSPHGNDDDLRPDDTAAAASNNDATDAGTPDTDHPTTPIDDRPRYGERLPGYGSDGSYTPAAPSAPVPSAPEVPTPQYRYGQQSYEAAASDQNAGNQNAGNDNPTDQYTAPYPAGQYGQQSQYGQQDQYGQQTSQYGQRDQYGQQNPYGQDQYGQQNPYGQSQAQNPYGQGQAPQNPYGSAHYPASSAQPGSTSQPASAVGYGDEQRTNGTYFAGANPAAAPAGTSTSARPNDRRRLVLPLLGMLAIGAIIGGLVGGGIGGAVANGRNSSTASSGTSGSNGHLTVNDYNSATVVTAVAAKATPSVVTINVSASSEAGTGSGVVMSKDGYIVTNTHVVTLDGASSSGTIQVTTSDGKIYKGKLIGTDPTVDLAVIKIDATNLTPIQVADSSKLNVGDTAIAIGAPLGLSNTVTDGIVSTLNRSIQVASSAPGSGSGDSNQGNGNGDNGPYDFWGNGGSSSSSSTVSLPVIQTDAPINPGNSGGALLDSKGKLIGINVAIASASSSSSSSGSQSGSIGVGFSIPSNLAQRVATEIMQSGKATHGLLGATVGDATDDANATQTGAVIKSVTSGGAAAGAGLQKGDVVTSLGGIQVTDATDLTAQVRYLAGGSKTTVTYLRNGQSHTADVTLGTYDSNS